MIRIFLLVLFFPCMLAAQTGMQMLSYSVTASLNEQSGEFTGVISVQLLVTVDSLQTYTFLVPKEMRINSINDASNESIDFDRDQTNYSKYAVTIQLPNVIRRDDSLMFSFPYTALYDTSHTASMFVNQREFLLPCTDSVSWLPTFGTVSTLQYSCEVILPSHVTLIAHSSFDTTAENTSRIWRSASSNTAALFAAFTLCGISDAIVQTCTSSDSLNTVSFVSSPMRFNQQYAKAIASQINDAMIFFSLLTRGRNEAVHRTYAIIGNDQFNTSIIDSKYFIVHHNSPAYMVYDSIALISSAENVWLANVAQYYCPATNDSTALFREGFASYLVGRYLLSRFPQFEKEERIISIASSLTFFPYGTVAAGRTVMANATEVFAAKGRYIFLMLEYILGQETLDNIIVRMNERFSSSPISFAAFQQMCEEEYGTPLEWFFDQWLNRTSAPEVVMQWKNEKTVRGMSIVRLTIEQRGDIFLTPINIAFHIGGRSIQKRVVISQQKHEFSFVFSSPPTMVELDPNYNILRWLLEVRILAHARSAKLFLSVNRDITTSEREALYTVQLDPNNSTGSIPFAYYTLGKIAVLKNDLEQAKEYFLKSMPLSGTRETEMYKLLSLVRYANIIEMEGNREEAKVLYRRAMTEGQKNPLVFERVMIAAGNYLLDHFVSHENIWFGTF